MSSRLCAFPCITSDPENDESSIQHRIPFSKFHDDEQILAHLLRVLENVISVVQSEYSIDLIRIFDSLVDHGRSLTSLSRRNSRKTNRCGTTKQDNKLSALDTFVKFLDLLVASQFVSKPSLEGVNRELLDLAASVCTSDQYSFQFRSEFICCVTVRNIDDVINELNLVLT